MMKPSTELAIVAIVEYIVCSDGLISEYKSIPSGWFIDQMVMRDPNINPAIVSYIIKCFL